MNKPELLAPAGEIESVYASFAAGADAVYLGGPLFSARAFAKNNTVEEICAALDYAHSFDKKIYLTLNTLLKNDEIKDAYNLIKPLYDNGLDGIIIQDFSLVGIIKDYFPDLDLHASTQMAVMSSEGVKYLKEKGFSRVVPARELSLEEISNLTKVGPEIECFIHGAMCYSYSGKCLFSSIAGGRSGNRGRCAGPCRKEYDTFIDGEKVNSNNEKYPISMRDMCTARNIHEMIEAGVSSFKIEGRMKSPEYSAGVSSIYRRIIDDYFETGRNTCNEKDISDLNSLYIRSGAGTGYLKTHNGREMITLSSGCYNGNEKNNKSVGDQFIQKRLTKDAKVYFKAYIGEKMLLTVSTDEFEVTCEGGICEEALNKGTDKEQISKQLSKMGGTIFNPVQIKIDTDGKCFLRVSDLNSLRREAVALLSEKYLFVRNNAKPYNPLLLSESSPSENKGFKINVSNKEQLGLVLKYDFYDGIIVDVTTLGKIVYSEDLISLLRNRNIYFKLPTVARDNCINKIKRTLKEVSEMFENYNISVKGIYVGSIDSLAIAEQYFDKKNIYLFDGLYVFNNLTEKTVVEDFAGYTASYELSGKELTEFVYFDKREMIIYGFIPLMYSAGCIYKTFFKCDKNTDKSICIEDENSRRFPVLCNHEYCFNIIYNCVPLNLFKNIDRIMDKCEYFRIDFSVEKSSEVISVMDDLKKYVENTTVPMMKDNTYTTGHFKRGVD